MTLSPMQQMLNDREERMTQEREANASLVEHYANVEIVNPRLRTVWKRRPLPVYHGDFSTKQVDRARAAWGPHCYGPLKGPPATEVVERVRKSWELQDTRRWKPFVTWDVASSIGFWSWIQWLGTTHTVRDYTLQYHQHIDLTPHEIGMLTFESCKYLNTLVTGSEHWSIQTPVPMSISPLMKTDVPTGLDRMNANINTVWGVVSKGKRRAGLVYWDDTGADATEINRIFIDTLIYIEGA